MTTRVQLEIFEGPLDLLLHLIKKNEVSVADIPVATITEQYLATLELMQSLNLDLAGEFLVMAATLVHLKSKTLLPDEAGEEEEEEEGDSKEELIRRLQEYQRFKQAADELEKRDILGRDAFLRAPEPAAEGGTVELETVSLFDLISALRQVLDRFPAESFHQVTLEKVSVRERMMALLDDLHRLGQVVFQSFFEQAKSRLDVVVTFLAMLELVKMRAVRIWQEERLGPIVIELAAPVEDLQGRIAEAEEEDQDHGA